MCVGPEATSFLIGHFKLLLPFEFPPLQRSPFQRRPRVFYNRQLLANVGLCWSCSLQPLEKTFDRGAHKFLKKCPSSKCRRLSDSVLLLVHRPTCWRRVVASHLSVAVSFPTKTTPKNWTTTAVWSNVNLLKCNANRVSNGTLISRKESLYPDASCGRSRIVHLTPYRLRLLSNARSIIKSMIRLSTSKSRPIRTFTIPSTTIIVPSIRRKSQVKEKKNLFLFLPQGLYLETRVCSVLQKGVVVDKMAGVC